MVRQYPSRKQRFYSYLHYVNFKKRAFAEYITKNVIFKSLDEKNAS